MLLLVFCLKDREHSISQHMRVCTYPIVQHERLRSAYTKAQTGQSFHCLHTQSIDVDEYSDQTLDL